MTIIRVAPTVPSEAEAFLNRAGERARGLMLYGDPLAPYLRKPEQDEPSWWDVYSARSSEAFVQRELAEAFYRPRGADPDFNPYRYIESDPGLKNDPVVSLLAERGQFDDSASEDQFLFDLQAGQQWLSDQDTIQSAGSRLGLRRLSTFWLAQGGDPINYLPLGVIGKMGQGANMATHVAQHAAMLGTLSLSGKFLENITNPVSNEPGIWDEAIAAGVGASIGGGIGLITSPVVKGSTGRWLGTRKLQQLRTSYQDVLKEPLFSQPDPVTQTTASTRVTMRQEFDRGTRLLQKTLGEAPTDNRVITALNRPGDNNANLIDALRQKYTKAGKTLQVIEHPEQGWYEVMEDMRKIIDHPGLSAEATPADFDYNKLDALFTSVSARYSDLQSAVMPTPGGRAARNMLGHLNDVYRTLSGSAQTIGRGSALDPFNFNAGTSAENMKEQFSGWKDRAVIDLRKTYGKAKGRPITYDGASIGRFDYGGFRSAVHDYMRRINAREHGFTNVTIPVDTDPLIKEAAEGVRNYFNQMYDVAERSGAMEVGPLKLQQLRDEQAAMKAKLAAPSKRLTAKGKAKIQAEIQALDNQIAGMDAAVQRMQKGYLPRMYDVARVMANPDDFRAKLTTAFRRQHYGTTPEMDAHLQADVGENIGLAKLLQVEPEELAVLQERDLPPDLLTAYRAELAAFWRRNADTAFETITNPKERHGVVEAIREQPVKTRLMAIDESDVFEYLERDLENILHRYDRVMGGEIGVRRAIQLNPAMAGQTLEDGTPIRSSADLVQSLNEKMRIMELFASRSDEVHGTKGTNKAMAETVRTLRRRVEDDIILPLQHLTGRASIDVQYPFLNYLGRNLTRLSFLNKAGSFAWAMMNDLAPVTMYMMQRPETLRLIPEAIGILKGATRRDIELLGMGFDGINRARALSDIDYLHVGSGFGEGRTRIASARVERGLERMTDWMSRVNATELGTRVQKQVGGVFVIDRVTTQSKRLLRAKALIDGGMDEAAALRKVGLHKYDAARINKMGFNTQRARWWHEQTFKHGLLPDDTPIARSMTFDEYMQHKGVVKNNFDDWDISSVQGRDFWDVLTSNIGAEVDRSLVVTPGVFDRPKMNRSVLGRMVNQFQSFTFAFVNQRLRVMAQMPAKYQLWYAMSYQFFGAMSDAISNHLSGRRSFEETVRQWQQNPMGMMYAAWDRSGLSGVLNRPLAIMDAYKVPFSPGVVLGNTVRSTAAAHVEPNVFATIGGPPFGDIQKGSGIVGDILTGKADQWTAYNAWKLAPYQNLMWLRMLHQGTGVPVVPEAIKPKAN